MCGGRCLYHGEVSPLPVSDTPPAGRGRGCALRGEGSSLTRFPCAAQDPASRGRLPVPASRCHPRLATEEPRETCISRAVVGKIPLRAPVPRALDDLAWGFGKGWRTARAQQPGCPFPGRSPSQGKEGTITQPSRIFQSILPAGVRLCWGDR